MVKEHQHLLHHKTFTQRVFNMPSLFANPLAQKVFSYLIKKAGFEARDAIGLVSQKMNDNQALIKLMKQYGYKPKKVTTTKKTTVEKPIGAGGKE